jgi:hypothetical protein
MYSDLLFVYANLSSLPVFRNVDQRIQLVILSIEQIMKGWPQNDIVNEAKSLMQSLLHGLANIENNASKVFEVRNLHVT